MAVAVTKKFTCPRRVEDGRDQVDSPFTHSGPNLDEWHGLHPLGGGEKVAPPNFRQCNYCGSLHPDDLFTAIELGHEIGPTDKDYKIYVCADHHDYAKLYFQHLSDDQKHRFLDLLNERKIRLSYPGYFYRLPFFIAPRRPGTGY